MDGTVTLHQPANSEHVSYSLVKRAGSTGDGEQCSVYRLRTIMGMLGHSIVDLLKMDVEACEYAVIRDILSDAIPIRQFCVEFHDRDPGIGIRQTSAAISQLRSAGYRMFSVSPSGEEFSFLRDAVA